MPLPSKTKASTRRLSEVARHVVMPSGIVTTGWSPVRAKCLEFGDRFDEWQDGAGRLILGKRADGLYAATVGGVVLSIPRQVAKTFLVMRIVFALCVLFPGLTVLWTAHHTRTLTKTFRSAQAFAKRKKVGQYIATDGRGKPAIRTANGEQEILFTNGSIIMFGARDQGFGRGFEEVDVEVFDEAQILTEKALEDMVAATMQSRHPHGALLFYMGTPPRPADPGEAFALKRSKALSGRADDLVYIECSADEDADPDDRAQWGKANPSYPHRTPLASMLRLRENLPSDEAWKREALGIWDPVATAQGVFAPGAWSDARTHDEPPPPAALGVAADLDQSWLSLAAASPSFVGAVCRVRSAQQGEFVADVARIARERDVSVAIDRKGPASHLIPDLESAGVPLVTTGVDELVAACADFRVSIDTRGVQHGDHVELNEAAAMVGWRAIGDRRVFGRKGGDISMLEAAALALWLARDSEAFHVW